MIFTYTLLTTFFDIRLPARGETDHKSILHFHLWTNDWLHCGKS